MTARSRVAEVSGIIAIGLFVAPIVLTVLRDVSLIVPQHEFIGYRYFTSLSIVEGEPENVFVVQGVPMGIVQHIIVWVLAQVLGQPSAAIATLECFAKATLLVAYGASAGLLFAAFFLLRAPLLVRGLIGLVAATPWYAWSYGAVPFLLAPEYWVFEISYALAASIWVASLQSKGSAAVQWGMREVVGIGLWLAIGATLKVSLVGIGALPVLLRLKASSASVRQAGGRLCIVVLASVLWALAIVWIYFIGDTYYAGKAVQDFVAFILPWSSGEHHAVQKLNFDGLWHALAAPETAYARWSITSFLLATSIGLLTFRHGARRPERMLLCASAVAFFLGHVLVVYARPSSTSLFDLSLYALAVVPMIAGSMTEGRHRMVLGVVCLVPIVWLAVMSQGWKIAAAVPAAEYERAKQTIGDVQRYVESVQRPRVLFIPDNNWTGQTIDQIVLFHGRLGLGDVSEGSLRNRVLPRAEMIGGSEWELQELRRRILAGHMIVWADQEGRLSATETFPVLQLLERENVVFRSWTHEALGPGRRIYAAFIDRPAAGSALVITMRAVRDADPSGGGQVTQGQDDGASGGAEVGGVDRDGRQ